MVATSPPGRKTPVLALDGKISPVREPTAGSSYLDAVSKGKVDKRSTISYTPSLRLQNPWASLFRSSGLSPAFSKPGDSPNRKLNGDVQTLTIADKAEHLRDPSTVPPSSGTAQSAAETPPFSFPTSPQQERYFDESGRAQTGCTSVVDYFNAKPGTKGGTGRLSYLQRSANAKINEPRKQQSLLDTSNLSTADVENFLDTMKSQRLDPPKTYHEKDDMRQKVIQSLEAETVRLNEPGGSWVPRAGALPAARAMPKSPDKEYVDKGPGVNPERLHLLKRLRFAFHSIDKNHHSTLLDFFSQFDAVGSGCLERNLFFRLLEDQVKVELSSADQDLLVTLFQSSDPHCIDFVEFTYRMFDVAKDVRINKIDADHQVLAKRMRASCVFDDLNVLRPMSQSGRYHTFSDIHQQMDRPLVLPAGTGPVPGRYQFMSEHEKYKMQKKYPDPSPPREVTTSPKRSAQEHSTAFREAVPERAPTPRGEIRAAAALVREEVEGLRRREEVGETLTLGSEDEESATERIGPNVQVLSLSDTTDGDARPQSPSDFAMAEKRASTPTILKGVHGKLMGPKETQHSVSFTGVSIPSASPQLDFDRPAPRGPSLPGNEYLPTIDGTYRRWGGKLSRSVPQSRSSEDEEYERRRATAEAMRPHTPSWSVRHRWTPHSLRMAENLTHDDGDGSHLTNSWGSSNLCNQDIPVSDRLAMYAAVKKENLKNAAARSTSWSFSHSGASMNPSQWTSTSQDQQNSRPRIRTPQRHRAKTLQVPELRPPPWVVAERHLVHLQQYDHRVVGLPRPQPLARKSL